MAPGARWDLPTEDDLAETAELIPALRCRVVTGLADLRDFGRLKTVMDSGRDALGQLDIVVAGAANASYCTSDEIGEASWNETIDSGVKGLWRTINAAVPHLLAQETGSIIVCASAAGVIGPPGLTHHVAARYGAIGLMQAFASQPAGTGIRVNAVCPTQIDTPIIAGDGSFQLPWPEVGAPTRGDAVEMSVNTKMIPVAWAEPRDVSNAVLFLASDEARYITGTSLPVDAGIVARAVVG